MKVIKAPDLYSPGIDPDFSIFLAGSRIADWRSIVCKRFIDFDIAILDPYRDDRKNKWGDWDLFGLSRSNLILMNLVNETRLCIPFFELGFSIKTKKLFLVCDVDLQERDSFKEFSKNYRIPLFDALPTMLNFTKQYLRGVGIKETQ